MPTFRTDLETLPIYVPGKPIDEVARDLGIDDIVKIASNEHPEPPFPEVREVIAAAASDVNRYPEDSSHYLVAAIAKRLMVSPDHVWMGAGSTQLLGCVALAVGGRDTSAVYADPSFVMYPIATRVAGSRPIPVPADELLRHDLDAMYRALADDTTVVYICNPNNPTGTHLPSAALDAFIERVPERILIVIDEAYAEYATAPDYRSAIPHAISRSNVIVTRTFSKIYGLAGLRVGYAIGIPETVKRLRRVQPPFSVNSVAQAAALVALDHHDRLEDRAKANATARDEVEAMLAQRGLEFAPSQTNFVLFQPPADPTHMSELMLGEGVIVRPMESWIRTTIGTPAENSRFAEALDAAIGALST